MSTPTNRAAIDNLAELRLPTNGVGQIAATDLRAVIESLTASASFRVDNLSDLTDAAAARGNLGVPSTATTITAGTGLTGGGSLAANITLALSSASIASLLLADTAVQPARAINTGTGLSGGGNLSADRTIALANTAVSAGSYGSASAVGTFTVDAQGRLTAAASTTIAIAGEAITTGTIADARLPTSQAGKTFTSATQFPSGTAALPGVAFSGDVDTGIWRPAADTLAASTNGTERLRITSSGNVGIGTSSPTYGTLEVAQGSAGSVSVVNNTVGAWAFRKVRSDGSNGMGIYDATGFGVPAFYAGNAERMRIDASGNVGIGTTTPSSFGVFTIGTGLNNSVAYIGKSTGAGGAAGGFHLGVYHVTREFAYIDAELTNGTPTAETGVLRFGTANAGTLDERMRITSTGNVGIGTSAPSAAARLDVASTTSGFLPPRMTTTQRDAITSPPNGLMLYNSTTNKLQARAGGAWVDLH